ncbi:MAG: MarR family transcriptional regulator [Solirubrobacteraceae bacterium]
MAYVPFCGGALSRPSWSAWTEAQHQLLLTIRAFPDPHGPTLTDVAAALLIRHDSAVGLVNRAQEAGLIVRERDDLGRRRRRRRRLASARLTLGRPERANSDRPAALPRLVVRRYRGKI